MNQWSFYQFFNVKSPAQAKSHPIEDFLVTGLKTYC